MLAKAQAISISAVKALSKLNGEFELWGEPLIAEHIAEDYKDALSNVKDTLSNFGSRFNTVAKLNNFTYTLDQIEKLGKDMSIVMTVLEYDTFKNDCAAEVSYLMNLERMELPALLSEAILDAKANFRKIRDDIPDEMCGSSSAIDLINLLSRVKSQYIDLYFAEHQRKRLGVSDGKRKGEMISSGKLANLKRLKSIGILPVSKLDSIEKDLSGLKVCFELTPEMLRTIHFCTKCHFLMGEGDLPVKGKLDEIDDRMDILLTDWTKTLLITIDDPLVLDQKQYLTPDQQTALDYFLKSKTLPEKIDAFFMGAIEALLQGFEPVNVSANVLIDRLEEFGPLDVETFKNQIISLVDNLTKGKDKEKIRIVVKR